MFPQPMSRSEIRPDDSHPDPTRTLEQHLVAGFPPDLALDLVLNELVIRAAQATHASAAALALARGDEMVCRASTGHLAPDLGVPLNTRDGLSGACLQTRQPQLSVDTEFDPRVDPALSRRLGIRSILIVPVFDTNGNDAQVCGILEVFSASPAAFSHNDQKVLECFAEECVRIRQAAVELSDSPRSANLSPIDLTDVALLPLRRPPYEVWTLVLGALAILATIAVSLLIGSRIGWLRPTASQAQISQPANSLPVEQIKSATPRPAATKSAAKKSAPARSAAAPPVNDDLVVYERGKVIFRLKPTPTESDRSERPQAKPDSTHPNFARQDRDSIVDASSKTKIAPPQRVWLAPAEAETRLLARTEPEYPPDARAAHRAGNVVLEVQVAEDGSVANIRTLSGDPLLAAAAAQAVRSWRYQPYRPHDHPSQFQTDVTLSFALPN
jgi:TonB family protein